MTILADKRIVLGVSGGVACYKALELTRLLVKADAVVDCILTEAATEFVRPLAFAALSHRPVHTTVWEASGQAAAYHIELGAAADVLLVCPATATTIARLAHGMADTMLSLVALSCPAPLVLAPAMDHHMWLHPAVQANLDLLRQRGATIVPPEAGELASGAVGWGRLAPIETVVDTARAVLGRGGPLAGRRVVVSAGGTREFLDPVRYLGNRSTGRMGYAIAAAARDRGAVVTLVSGPSDLRPPAGMEIMHALSAADMRRSVLAACEGADALIMAAAVADYTPSEYSPVKVKKSEDDMVVRLTHADDVLLATIPFADRLVRVGFAAETNNLEANAQAKLVKKKLDMLVLNDVSRADSGFAAATNQATFIFPDREPEELPLLSKEDVAERLLDRLQQLIALRLARA